MPIASMLKTTKISMATVAALLSKSISIAAPIYGLDRSYAKAARSGLKREARFRFTQSEQRSVQYAPTLSTGQICSVLSTASAE